MLSNLTAEPNTYGALHTLLLTKIIPYAVILIHMKHNKPSSTLAAIIISIFGFLFELWTANFFSYGGAASPVVYLIPYAFAIICIYLTYLFSKNYSQKKATGALALISLTIFSISGFLINVLFLVYSFSKFHIN